jgi:hypothetical protein
MCHLAKCILESSIQKLDHVPIHYLIFYNNKHMKNVLLHHLEEISELPLSWALSQLIYLLHYYQVYPNFLDHKYHKYKMMAHQHYTLHLHPMNS